MMRRPTPGNGEDLLDDHGAAEKCACDDSGDRQNRNERIRKAVTQHDFGALQPLGVGRADEILIQDFQHRGSGHARDEADLDDGQRQGRHDDARQPAEGVLAERARSRRSGRGRASRRSSRISMIPSQKSGTDNPNRAAVMTT